LRVTWSLRCTTSPEFTTNGSEDVDFVHRG
jgi:hypothetical protein